MSRRRGDINNFRKTVQFSSGEAEVKVAHRSDYIEVKAMVFNKPYRGADGKGEIVKVKYRVPSTHVRIKLTDGTIIKSRSCCKPPDHFNRKTGLRLAVRRLIKNDTVLTSDDHRLLMETLCPGFFKNKKLNKLTQKTMF